MESLKSKKELRKKKKINKMSALVAVASLNERDKKAKEDKNAVTDDASSPKKARLKTEVSNESSDQCENVEDYLILPENKNYEDLKTEVKQLKSHRVHPQFFLKGVGEQASLSQDMDNRIPILFTDLQHLLLTSLLGEDTPCKPRWCNLKKIGHISNVFVLVIENTTIYHYVANESIFNFSKSIFSHKLEVVTPSLYGGSVIEELAVVPLSKAEKDSLIKQYGSLDAAIEARKDLMIMMRAIFPVTNVGKSKSIEAPTGDTFSRTQLVLSAWQLVEENYPCPLKGKLEKSYAGYVKTKDTYGPITSKSPMFGLDCEMCQTTVGSELTRVSLVNEKHETIYEKLVLPYNKIINYLTMFSGVKASDLENVTTRIEDVQRDLRELLPPDAILVGQSLHFDLHALKMMHPYVIDTSIIFNLSGQRSRKSKLQLLAKHFLKETIQESGKGHCSVEDSLTALKLVQLKLSKGMSFGDAVLEARQAYYEKVNPSKTVEKEYTTNIFNETTKKQKSLAILGEQQIVDRYNNYVQKISTENAEQKIEMCSLENNAEIIKKSCELFEEKNLVISHIKLEEDDNTCRPKVLKHLDRFIKKLWKSLKINSLMIVVLTGDEKANGVALIDVKNTHTKL